MDAATLRILDVNAAAVARYGYSRPEFLKLTARDLRPPEDLARLDTFLADQLARLSGFEPAGRWRHRARSGEVFDVDVTWARIRFRGRKALIVFAQDISRERAAEQVQGAGPAYSGP